MPQVNVLELFNEAVKWCTPNKSTEPLSNKVKDISEPVISFLKVFENNPKRFKIVGVSVDSWNSATYNFIDTFNSESWHFTRRWFCTGGYTYSLPSFLTKAEKSLIVERLESYYSGRKKRLTELKELRRQRALNKERDRLTKIYEKDVI